MANKYYALQKDVFDISKVTVVGSPTITDDGVASGFSGSNAVISNYYMDFTKTNWEILTPKFSISVFSRNNPVISNYDSSTEDFFIFVRTNGKISWQITTSKGGTNIFKKDAPITLQTNTNYQLKFTFDGSKYKLYLATENGAFVEIDSVNTTIISTLKDCRLSIGRSISQGAVYMTTDLNAFKIYVDGQLVYSPTKPTYLIERRKPKVWNKGQFTIVGNPSISESGVASGFNSSNYLGNITINASSGNEFIFNIKYTHKHQSETQGLLAAHSTTVNIFMYCVVNSSDKVVSAINNLGYASSNITLVDGQTYDIQYKTNFKDYYEIYINGTLEISRTIESQNVTIDFVSLGRTLGTQYNTGTFDLTQFKIYTDNNLVFDGGAETYVYDPSKFTIVGSPTITEYGVASGFSSSSYFQLQNISSQLQNATNWSIKIPIIFAEGTTTTRQEIFGGGVSGTAPFSLIVRLWTNGYIIVPVNGVSNTDNFSLQSKQTVVANTLYNLEVKVQDNVIYFYINEELQAQHNITEKVKFDDILRLGVFINTSNYFKGSIDLPSISITVDGKEVFTGAKVGYYVLRG